MPSGEAWTKSGPSAQAASRCIGLSIPWRAHMACRGMGEIQDHRFASVQPERVDSDRALQLDKVAISELIRIYQRRTRRGSDVDGATGLVLALENHGEPEVLMTAVLDARSVLGLWLDSDLTRLLGFTLGPDLR